MTNPTSNPGSGDREPKDGTPAVDSKPKKTPSTDMQADDAGTADSGVDTGSGTAAESAMKQTSKTETETGSPR